MFLSLIADSKASIREVGLADLMKEPRGPFIPETNVFKHIWLNNSFFALAAALGNSWFST